MMFIRTFTFFLGVLATLFLGWAVLIGVPDLQLARLEPAEELQAYTAEQLFGRQIYIREGCVYCHSQQTRPEGFGADQQRFWGRPSVPADYVYDKPHLLGTMRTGPDLFNIGARQPSEDWHLLHLYNPRALVKDSLMPPYPWLFEEKQTAGPDERVIDVPPPFAPAGRVVVAKPEALALVQYLLGLDHTYPLTQKKARQDTQDGEK